ncbi:hypothetical protein I4U23_027599 [Adineta vaga]|nr:hypothetical protein I4U23_027599 [Adineta vaga]
MKIYFYSILCIVWCYAVETAQPYFPSQIVFSIDDGLTLYAIDEINQRAFGNFTFGVRGRDIVYAMEHLPFAIPGTLQSKYYVQLVTGAEAYDCMYATYWKYGALNFNRFPEHWLVNSSFKVNNYMKFSYPMIHSNDSSIDEDYWYANTTCHGYPCQEIYFQKNTDIPRRLIRVIRRTEDFVRITTNFKVISMGKPDDKYFNSIPKNWYSSCRDYNLGPVICPRFVRINITQSTQLRLYLAAPPHRVNGSDTVRIRWKATECIDCVTWTPFELIFNTNNYAEEQILTITRVKNALQTFLSPFFYGGDYDYVQPDTYNIGIA